MLTFSEKCHGAVVLHEHAESITDSIETSSVAACPVLISAILLEQQTTESPDCKLPDPKNDKNQSMIHICEELTADD